PAIVSRNSARLYPVTVWCEAIPGVDVDRGGRDSFAIWTLPDFPELLLKHPPEFKGMRAFPVSRKWRGWEFQIENPALFRPVENAVRLLTALRDHLGTERLFNQPEARPAFFDQLMGTSTVR